MSNIDQVEINKFNQMAAQCWDPNGDFKPLHDLNPIRMQFLQQHSPLTEREILDVGCGGGILTEALARTNANVMGIDLANELLSVAELHRLESGLNITYQKTTVEALSITHPQHFDVITCMEMLEHVPDPLSVIAACAKLAKPNADLFFSTINRSPKGFLHAIVGAEYILKILPKGTHHYRTFIKPAELAQWLRHCGLTLQHSAGIQYNVLTKTYSLSQDLSVNYIFHATKDKEFN